MIPLDNVHEWTAARAELVAAVPDAAVDDRDAGSVSVVGARAGAGAGRLQEVLAAVRAAGEEPRALLATSTPGDCVLLGGAGARGGAGAAPAAGGGGLAYLQNEPRPGSASLR